ncbi:MAG: Rrf2 family transcriptional regulator [Clostridia bacterium]|nr:Rrf2 family transcriptional regulator [Clostridia bacterium]
MKISTKGRYALRIMVEFAEHEGEVLSLKSVAESQNISLKYLEQIVQMLVKADLLDSFRGTNGGYKLSQPASQIKVSTILRATEGDLTIVTCLGDEACVKHAHCRARKCWDKLNQLINGYLDNLSLAELVGD